MANTSIRIKRSTSTSSPANLLSGEFAYSYLSNTLFIGTSDGASTLNVGGQYYTSQVDQATNAATPSTLVRRDATGNASFNNVVANGLFIGTLSGSVIGSANNADQLTNSRDFSISGGDISAAAVSFNGTQNVTLNASLNTVPGLTAGVYGGTSAIPVVTVAANGRVMAISNTTISTSFNISGDTGTDTVNGGDTISFVGGDGITTAVTDNTISYAVDNTVFRSNTAMTKQLVDGDVQISGNLTVLGTETIINVQTLNISDPLLILAGNNQTSDVVDIGFVGHYNDGANRHAGVFRHAGTKEFYVFDNYGTELSSNNTIDVANNTFRVATLNANIKSQFANVTTANVGTVNASSANLTSLTLGTALGVPSGGTGAASFTSGAIIIGDGTNALTTLANSTYTATGTGAQNNTVTSVTVDAYGRVTAATFQAISGLTVGQGGTGVSSFTAGQILIGDGAEGIKQLANVTSLSETVTAANTVNSFTTDVYGRVTGFTQQPISGLSVSQGGTGASTFTAGQLVVGNGTGALQTIANSTFTPTGSGGQASTLTSLTVDTYGRVTAATWETISGLSVSQGGTGASTFAANGIIYGAGTGALQVTAAAGVADQTWSNQLLTVTNAGVPVWTSALDGGQF
jgi:hypothetical protein